MAATSSRRVIDLGGAENGSNDFTPEESHGAVVARMYVVGKILGDRRPQINPDLILSQNPRALTRSAAGAGDFDKPESWKSMEGLVQCPANHAPLSPISFLERAAKVYRDRTSLVYGSFKFTWSETHLRCLMLASALTHLGISSGDVVANFAPNVPAMYELHFAVPMAGAVLCTLNTRHDSNMVSNLLLEADNGVRAVPHSKE